MNLSNVDERRIQLSTVLTDPETAVVADASAAISITASGHAAPILHAIPNHFAVPDVVVSELESGGRRGHANADQLKELVDSGLVEIVTMGDEATIHFEKLVVGPARSTLDDGEAATIACALERNAIPLIDERKGRHICANRYPDLRLGSTTDVFVHPEVGIALGDSGLTLAVLNALKKSRMRVLDHHLTWVVDLIGTENAASCESLPRHVRMQGKPSQLRKSS